MQTIQEIERAVSRLSKADLVNFREWFDNFDQDAWDQQFEEDVASGKQDSFADQAIAGFKMGKCTEI